MAAREAMNKYMAKRRARLKEEGICVDCQTAKVSPPPSRSAATRLLQCLPGGAQEPLESESHVDPAAV